MKMLINEIAKLADVSVRTLHYYDEIGLLKPSAVDEQNGYRFYDENSLERLQAILFYRELDFPLKDISKLLSSPNYDRSKALTEQKHLLTLKKERMERLIFALDSLMKGENTMDFKAFDNSEFEAAREKYAAEAKEKWGNTDAYKEHSAKTSAYSGEKWAEVNSGMEAIMKEFAECKLSWAVPEDAAAQSLVKKWQDFITENHYTCTKEILAGLGEMYSADERFTANIDKYGEGTAQFMTDAIRAYCR